MAVIATPLDFLGVNYYSREVVRADEDGEPDSITTVPDEELTEMGWEVFPRGLHDILVRINEEYGPEKIYITENGAAFEDVVGEDGRIADARRIEYLRDHLAAVHRALTGGVPLRGYFVWSFMDNFEWAHGYTKRFGLYRIDFPSQRRMAKESAFWYRDVIASNSINDGK
jgi:beta-glucosidase